MLRDVDAEELVMTDEQANSLFASYMQQIERVIEVVDQLPVEVTGAPL